MTEIAELNLTQAEPLGTLHCDLCDTEPTTTDREWLAPGKWRYTKVCPECDRQTTVEMEAAYPHMDRDGWANRIKRIYAESEMSEESLERSLDRVFGLDEDEDR